MTIETALSSLSNYPIPTDVVERICVGCGIDQTGDVTKEIMEDKPYKEAMGRVYEFLAVAPNVSEGDIDYSFSSSERTYFTNRAKALLSDAGVDNGTGYGWQGEDY